MVGRPVVLEKLASSVCERHEDRLRFVAIERGDSANQVRYAQPVKVAVPQVAGPPAIVQQFIHRHHAERTDSGERANLGSAKLHCLVTEKNALALASSWQIEPLTKDLAGIE